METTINAQTIINAVMAAHAVAPEYPDSFVHSTLQFLADSNGIPYGYDGDLEADEAGHWWYGKESQAYGKILADKAACELRALYDASRFITFRTSARGTHRIINDKAHLQRFADLVRKNAAAFGGGLIKEKKERAPVAYKPQSIALFKQLIEDKDYSAALQLADEKLAPLFYISTKGVAGMQVAPIPLEEEPRLVSAMYEDGTWGVIEPISMLSVHGDSVINKKTRNAQVENVMKRYQTLKGNDAIFAKAATMPEDQSAARAQWMAEHGIVSDEAISERIEQQAEQDVAERIASQATQDVAEVVAQAVAVATIADAMAPSEAVPGLVTCEAESEAQDAGMGNDSASHVESAHVTPASMAASAYPGYTMPVVETVATPPVAISTNIYATDGACHNAQNGTYGHECGNPAKWLGTTSKGFTSGFCDHCKNHGDEAQAVAQWKKIEPLPPVVESTSETAQVTESVADSEKQACTPVVETESEGSFDNYASRKIASKADKVSEWVHAMDDRILAMDIATPDIDHVYTDIKHSYHGVTYGTAVSYIDSAMQHGIIDAQTGAYIKKCIEPLAVESASDSSPVDIPPSTPSDTAKFNIRAKSGAWVAFVYMVGALYGLRFEATGCAPVSYTYATHKERMASLEMMATALYAPEPPTPSVAVSSEAPGTQSAVSSARPSHDLQIGDVVCSSWGYDQTNVNHYQVTKLIGKRTVEVRELAVHAEETGYMSGRVAPVWGEFVGEPMRRTVDKHGNVNILREKFGRASKIEPIAIVHGVRCYAASHTSSYS